MEKIQKIMIEHQKWIQHHLKMDKQHWFSRFAADYALSDQIHLLAGFDWFGGDKGIFGTYRNNSEVWIKAKYSF